MSRYLLLFLLNLPFVLAGVLSAITTYKVNRTPKKRFVTQIIIWTLLLIGLITAEPFYNWLFSNNLTQTEPLSLFDVAQITAIIVVFYIANRSRLRIDALEKRVYDLHQELSIKLSSNKE